MNLSDFYPRTLNSKDYLAYYSKVFDFVEIDLDKYQQQQKNQMREQINNKISVRKNNNSFNLKNGYNNNYSNNQYKDDYDNITNHYYSSSFGLPTKRIIEKWFEETPSNFGFALKLPVTITNKIDEIGDFLETLAPLEEKILALRIHQTKLTLKDGRQWLEELLNICTYHGYSVALEFDHYSWFQDLTYHILKEHNAALVWSDTIGHSRHHYYYPVVTADFIYLRINQNERKWIEKVKEEDGEERKSNGGLKGGSKDETKRNRNQNREKGIEFTIIVVDKPPEVNRVLNLLSLPQRKYGHSQWIGRIILCVDLNAFFPSCEELRDPSLAGKPHAVIMTDQNKENISKGAVASCSYEARRFGVRSAISLSKAKELCPDLILNPVDMQYYREISDKVMRILEEYADSLEQVSIDEAYMDCTMKINSNPSLVIDDYVLQIKKTLKDQCGLLTSVGVANTKSVAKIASDFRKPDGLTIVTPDNLSSFLYNLPVGVIPGIGVKTQRILEEEFQIETVGHLAKQDIQKLIDKFGRKHGLWMWQVANGRDSEAVLPREDNISISSEQTLYPYTKDREKLLKHLHELVEEVYDRVSRKGYEFRTVGVKIVRSDFSIETREMSYSNYQNKQESIENVIEGLLDKFPFLFPENSPANVNTLTVRKVGIKLSNLIRIQKKKPSEQKTLLEYF